MSLYGGTSISVLECQNQNKMQATDANFQMEAILFDRESISG